MKSQSESYMVLGVVALVAVVGLITASMNLNGFNFASSGKAAFSRGSYGSAYSVNTVDSAPQQPAQESSTSASTSSSDQQDQQDYDEVPTIAFSSSVASIDAVAASDPVITVKQDPPYALDPYLYGYRIYVKVDANNYNPNTDENFPSDGLLNYGDPGVANEILIYDGSIPDENLTTTVPLDRFKFDSKHDYDYYHETMRSRYITLDRDKFKDLSSLKIVGVVSTYYEYCDKDNSGNCETNTTTGDIITYSALYRAYFPVKISIRAEESFIHDLNIVNSGQDIRVVKANGYKSFSDLTEGKGYDLKVNVDEPDDVEAIKVSLYVDGNKVDETPFTSDLNPMLHFTAKEGHHDMKLVVDSCLDFEVDYNVPGGGPHEYYCNDVDSLDPVQTYSNYKLASYETRPRNAVLSERKYFRYYDGKYDEREKSTILHPSQMLSGSFVLVDEWNRKSEGTDSNWFHAFIDGVEKNVELTYKGDGLYEWRITDWKAPSDYASHTLRLHTDSDVLPLGGYPEHDYNETIKVEKCYDSCNSCCTYSAYQEVHHNTGTTE